VFPLSQHMKTLIVGSLAIFPARCMLDCSSCTWHSCLAIEADMLKSCMK
jgi:hypothetical protein